MLNRNFVCQEEDEEGILAYGEEVDADRRILYQRNKW